MRRWMALGAAVAVATALPGVAMGKTMSWTKYAPRGDAKRAEVPAQYRWRLDFLYPSADAWEKAFHEAGARIPQAAACKGTLLADAASLGRCLDLVFDIQRVITRLQTYADADYSTDQASGEAKARTDRVQALSTRYHEAVAFVEPELLAAEPARLAELAKGSKGLAKYGHYLDDLARRRPHVKTQEVERVLALTGDLRAGPSFMQGALEVDVKFANTHDEDGHEQPLTMASFPRFRGSTNREVRREAVERFFQTLRSYARAFAASLDMAVKGNILVARTRDYQSAIESSMDQGAIPVSVYDVLVSTAEKNLPRTLHRYVALRKRLLGLDSLHYCDLYNPLFPAAKKHVTYPEAVDVAMQALKPLGADYLKVLSTGLDPTNGWVDVYPNAGKRSGAYCNASYRDHPVVFLNHMDELEDAFTVVHEFGHAMHFHLAHQAQEYVNADPPIFLAEIASTFNEELLLDHLLRLAATREERLNLLNKRIENLRTTVFRQIMFAEFERAIHQEVESGGALTAERMAEIYASLVRKYYGPEYVVGPDDGYEWEYIPHFYYNFYVYQYATGLMSAIALSRAVLAGEPGATARYLDFLKAGGSDYPVAILKRAGVDLTKPDAMQATFDLFAATLEEVDRLTSEPR